MVRYPWYTGPLLQLEVSSLYLRASVFKTDRQRLTTIQSLSSKLSAVTYGLFIFTELPILRIEMEVGSTDSDNANKN